MKLFAKLIVPMLAMSVLGMPALAQETPGSNESGERPSQRPPRGEGAPPGGSGEGRAGGMQRNPPMTAEKAKVAWEWQAKGVSKTLGLSSDVTTKVVGAYVEARTSHREASEKVRKEFADAMRQAADEGAEPDPDARRNQMAEMRKKEAELRKAETEKLSANLSKSLSADQVTKAMAPMGSFDANWDRMAHMLVEFKLEEPKMYEGLGALETYQVALAKFRDSDDRAGIRDATRQARESLSESLKKVLNEQQMEQMMRAGQMQQRGRGGDNGPGAPGAGRGGQGGRGGDGGGNNPET